ncbi:MAG TPA: hypothetical protein VLG68_04415 [Gammaproteobacteria bacterium]|nr:hypothetical protein [Gammaproteobacteria bacterium]
MLQASSKLLSWTEETTPARQPLLRALLHPYTFFLALALAVWLPDGFNIGGAGDGWMQLGAMIESDAMLRKVLPRMFGSLPMWLGVHLDTHGFRGLQAIMLAFTVLRAALMYEIAARLVPGNRHFALAAGLLTAFHPADRSFFWLGASGLHFAFVTALAACLCAVIYLQGAKRRYLLLTFIFQFLSGFTYSGFLPLMAALPAGAWYLERLAGRPKSRWFLLQVNVVIVAAIIADLVMIHGGVGRDSHVMDLSAYWAIKAYIWTLGQMLGAWWDLLVGLRLWYLLPACIMGLYGVLLWRWGGRHDGGPEPAAAPKMKWLIWGLFGLAGLSYLPYAISTVRYLPDRTLLGAGLFAYCALFLLFTERRTRFGRERLAAIMFVLLAILTTLTGLEKRQYWLDGYREQERLLSALARALPQPSARAFILVRLPRPDDAALLNDFTYREPTFTEALRYMYGDLSLRGGFYGFGNDRASFDARGMTSRLPQPGDGKPSFAGYPHLIMVDYFPDEDSVRIVDGTGLRAAAGLKADAAGYAPHPGTAPSSAALMCSMLEADFRPAYCLGPSR